MHEIYMKRALELAKQGFVSPNPQVGAVLVKDGHIVAEGYHKRFGAAHAEIELFQSLDKDFKYEDTVLYVSLEPCSHHGKTPPCVDAVIQRNIPYVVIACLDPNPLVSGNGVRKMQEAGINVVTGVLEQEAKTINEAFFKFITTKEPFVVVKSGISLDGKICTVTGESRWITSEASRKEVHNLRSIYTAIMVGINTVLADDPLLTSRITNGRNPIRIVVDSKLRTPLHTQIVQTARDIPTIIAVSEKLDKNIQPYTDLGVEILFIPECHSRLNLKKLMNILGKRNIDSILIEGGGDLMFSALESGTADKLQLYIAPILLGGSAKSFIGGQGVSSLQDAFRLSFYNIRRIEEDIVIEAYL